MAKGNTLASAYIAVGVETSGMYRQIQSSLKKALKDADIDSTIGEELGDGFDKGSKDGSKKVESNFSRASRNMGKVLRSDLAKAMDRGLSTLGRGAKRGIAAAGVGIAAGVGTALTKGFSRMIALENAEKSMEALLKNTENATEKIAQARKDADAAVQDTAFGIGDAMKAASMGMAAGVKEGKELEKYLKTIGNLATIANVPFDEMSGIMNKITANGKLTGETLLQLEERGFAAGSTLAEHFQVSQEEIRKMISAGEIGADDFMKAMEEFNGAALSSGETTTGALSNMMAAFGQVGEQLIGGSFGLVRIFANEVRAALQGVRDFLVDTGVMVDIHDDIMNGFGGGLEGAGERFSQFLKDNSDRFVIAIQGAWEQMKSAMSSLWEVITGGTGDPADALWNLMTIIHNLTGAISEVIQTSAPLIKDLGETGIATILTFMSIMTEVMTLLLPVLEKIAELWNGLPEGVQDAAINAIAFGIAFGWVLQILRPVFSLIGGIWKTLQKVWSTVSKTPFGKWVKNLQWVRTASTGISGIFGTISAVVGGILGVLGTIATVMSAGIFLGALGETNSWGQAVERVGDFWAWIWDLITGLPRLLNDPSIWNFATLWEFIKFLVDSIWAVIKNIPNMLSGLGRAVSDIMGGVVDWVFKTNAVSTQTVQASSAPTATPMTNMGIMAANAFTAARTAPESVSNRLAGVSSLMRDSASIRRNNGDDDNKREGMTLIQNITAPAHMNIKELSDAIWKQAKWEGRA